jgi:hypothetical protein
MVNILMLEHKNHSMHWLTSPPSERPFSSNRPPLGSFLVRHGFEKDEDFFGNVEHKQVVSDNSVSKWKLQATQKRDNMKISRTDTIWIADHTLEGVPENNRCHEHLQIAVWTCQQEARKRGTKFEDLLDLWMCDPDKSINKNPHGEVLDTLGQRGYPFMFRHDRVMTAKDKRTFSPPSTERQSAHNSKRNWEQLPPALPPPPMTQQSVLTTHQHSRP